MRRPVFAAILLAAAIAAPAVGAAEFKPKKTRLNENDIQLAIRKGVNFLKTAQLPQYHEKDAGKRTHSETFLLYAMACGGISRQDPVFQKYLKIAVDLNPDRTYEAACAAMALAEIDKAGYKWKLRQLAQWLVDNQCQNGQWSYGKKIDLPAPPPAGPAAVATGPQGGNTAPLYGVRYDKNAPAANRGNTRTRTPIKQRKRGPAKGDNSNSQYAALGLRACVDAGFAIDPACVRDALKSWHDSQLRDGSWSYSEGWNWGKGSDRGYGCMTAGAVGSIAIYRWMQGQSAKSDPAAVKGFNWLAQHWRIDSVPGTEGMGAATFHLYYLYGLERVGMLVGVNAIGGHNWYDEGGAEILKCQNPDGSWLSPKWSWDRTQGLAWDTCFAILFLARATKPLVYTG
jgi:hypothetical protein